MAKPNEEMRGNESYNIDNISFEAAENNFGNPVIIFLALPQHTRSRVSCTAFATDAERSQHEGEQQGCRIIIIDGAKVYLFIFFSQKKLLRKQFFPCLLKTSPLQRQNGEECKALLIRSACETASRC